MSDFRKLSNAIVDFDRVRAVVPCLTGGKGLEVWYDDKTDCDFIPSEAPVETLAQFYKHEFGNRAAISAQEDDGV
jgi:hypothetical protein